MTAEQIDDAARRHHAAERTRTPFRALSFEYPEMTLADAYAIQQRWIALKLAEGRRIAGRKIGLTSRAMQSTFGIDEPDYGALLDDMFFEDGARIPVDRFIGPMLEVELAFVLGMPLRGPGCTLYDVLEATRFVTPALELIDARSHRIDPQTRAQRRVVDTISDNAADAGVILGSVAVPPASIDLRWAGALFFRNGIIEETGLAAGVLNNPATGVAWLANRLAHHGVALEAGQIVLSGSFTRPVAARRGDTFHADFGPLGTVACSFA